jgi:glycosyltransferase involved in cell wall biosynthesis
MHILFFADHHPDSLGGVQTSFMLQKKFLERAGHTVTLVVSRRYRRNRRLEGMIEVPALPVPPTGAYSIEPSLKLAYRTVQRKLAKMALPVDIVHIQADMWGAILGAAWAKDHGLPLVQTVHTNLEVGISHTFGKTLTRRVAQVMNAWAASMLGHDAPKNSKDIWEFKEQISRHANYVTSPSAHFAKELEKHNVVKNAIVLPNGVDDDVVEGIHPAVHENVERTLDFVWAGRLSSEKRITEFLGAFQTANIPNAKLSIYGSGQLEAKVRILLVQLGLSHVANFYGRLPHRDLVTRFAAADLVAQSSVGFETQGMTVYEAIAVGTPVLVADPKIAAELPAEFVWLSKTPSVDDMARALTRAAKDIRSGHTKRAIDTGDWSVLQSQLTAKMIDLYQKAIKEGPKL